jgi:hypothetical protein
MRRRRLTRLVAIGALVAIVGTVIADALGGFGLGGLYPLFGAAAGVFVVVGWLIAERRPSNAEGPLLVAFGALFAVYLPLDYFLRSADPSGLADLVAVAISALDAPVITILALALIVFPDGRLPGRRWRWAWPAATIAITLAVCGYLFGPDPLPLYPDHRSPLGNDGFPAVASVYVAYAIMIVLLVAATMAIVVRWRRGDVTERAQIKWVAAAAIVLLVTEIANVITFAPEDPYTPMSIAATVAIMLVPVAMGIAILRYRLYEIDRIISRTLSYAIVTGVLAAIFVGVILLLQTALAGVVGSSGVPVAISTLAVFALFQPVLRRVRRAVDRRFDRARYDGERTASLFAERLRWETDMDRVTGDLARTADAAVVPKALGVWLRPPGADR